MPWRRPPLPLTYHAQSRRDASCCSVSCSWRYGRRRRRPTRLRARHLLAQLERLPARRAQPALPKPRLDAPIVKDVPATARQAHDAGISREERSKGQLQRRVADGAFDVLRQRLGTRDGAGSPQLIELLLAQRHRELQWAIRIARARRRPRHYIRTPRPTQWRISREQPQVASSGLVRHVCGRTATASSIGRDGLPVPFHAASYVDVVSMDLPRSLRHDRDGQHRWQVIIERREACGSWLR